MTQQATRESEQPELNQALREPVARRSQGQWVLVWREFRKRRLAVACGVLIVVLITISIFAPFLANDRPICYRGYNRFEYGSAARTLSAVLSSLAREKGGTAGRSDDTARIIDRQIAAMAKTLPPQKAGELDALKSRAHELVRARDRGDEVGAELSQIRRELRERFGARKVELVSRWHWPVVASLGAVEVVFLAFNVLLLLFPLWRLLVRWIVSWEHPGARASTQAGAFFLIPLLCGLAWFVIVPERVDRTNYKKGILASENVGDSRSPVVYEAVTSAL